MPLLIKQYSKDERFVAAFCTESDETVLLDTKTAGAFATYLGLTVHKDGLAIAINADKFGTPGWLYEHVGTKFVRPFKHDQMLLRWELQEGHDTYDAMLDEQDGKVVIYNTKTEDFSQPSDTISIMGDYLAVNATHFGISNWLFKLARK